MTNTLITAGLTSAEARLRQQQYGKNELAPKKKENFFHKVLHILLEPMFLLLLIAAVIYFILGEPRDGAIMLIFVLGIIGIDVIQQWKTDKTLAALHDLSAPHISVLRDGKEQQIKSCDLVPGDWMLICEGVKIPADGVVVKCADLCVDESSLSGEAEGIWKTTRQAAEPGSSYWKKDHCYAGTLVLQGSATVEVEKIGAATEYGQIGSQVAAAPKNDTPLQKQTAKLVKTCAIIAGGLMLLVTFFTWLNLSGHPFSERLIKSILSGITLAMAMIPEEFPVILTVFLSLGAWRLAKKNSLVRKLPSVETLGAVSVLCVDKTGTITMNQMAVQALWCAAGEGERQILLRTMGLACETETYDPMETAMLAYCEAHGITRSELFAQELVQEYAFTNELKMMGHVWQEKDSIRIAAKGGPERILALCELTPEERAQAEQQCEALAKDGLRVIAIATAYPQSPAAIPATLTDCQLLLLGLVGLADPARPGIADDIAICHQAGIRVVMITGDNGNTAAAIAKQVGIPAHGSILSGDQLDQMDDATLRQAVKRVSIFARVVPAHKMRIVKAFQENGETVAMTGDGVNDAPALKYADIGIAMGKRGSEVSREAADLILMDDNFTTIVETVKDGRRIYDNIRKAVGYVFTIHIPIALSSLLGPLLGIMPAALFLLPLHVVLLELLIDPTCSIVLERQPAERDLMQQPPRPPHESLLNTRLLSKSVLQGLVVFVASFGAYFFTLAKDLTSAATARAMGLCIFMLANLFLVQVLSSNKDFAIQTMRRLRKDAVMWVVNLGTLVLLAVILYSPLASYLKLAPLSPRQLLLALLLAAGSVLWYEVVKAIKQWSARKQSAAGR